MPNRMNAAMYYGIGDVRYEKTDVPEIGPGDVLLKIGAALTCGTDVKTYKRGHPILLRVTPALFGHEYAGTIEEIGKDVKGFEYVDTAGLQNRKNTGETRYGAFNEHGPDDGYLHQGGVTHQPTLIGSKIIN